MLPGILNLLIFFIFDCTHVTNNGDYFFYHQQYKELLLYYYINNIRKYDTCEFYGAVMNRLYLFSFLNVYCGIIRVQREWQRTYLSYLMYKDEICKMRYEICRNESRHFQNGNGSYYWIFSTYEMF